MTNSDKQNYWYRNRTSEQDLVVWC